MKVISTLLLIVRRSLGQHLLSTVVTVLSAALGAGLVMATFVVSTQSTRAFTGGPIGFDAVLGARGSKLQLVMNTVFHLETSPGNIPWSMYESMRDDKFVETAIPYAVGDNFKGYRVVGTTPELFTDFEYQEGSKFTPREGGRIFDPTRREAVIGATVARELDLNVRSTFQPYHGLSYDAESKLNEQHDEEYLIVGVLEPTNSPSDRVIWIPIEGVFRMEGHVLRGDGQSYTAKMDEVIPDEAKEVSAVMLKLPSARKGFDLDRVINKQGKVATLAWPIGEVMAKLFKDLGWMNRVLELVAYLVLAVVAGSILASLYNTMNERRREFAILRALGAKRGTVFAAIILESTIIAGLGALLGFLVYLAVLAGVANVVRDQTGVVLDIFGGHPAFLWTPIGMLLLGAASGLLPAFKAYSTDVAENLQPTS